MKKTVLWDFDGVILDSMKVRDWGFEQIFKTKQIKKFELTPKMWSVENEFLTPTMKVKRNTLKTYYKDLITKIYQ